MNEIKKLLKLRETQLLQWKKILEKQIKQFPTGTLRICKSQNRTQYYHRTVPDDFNGKYIPNNNISLAKNLAQKDYNQKLLISIDKELYAIQKYMQCSPQLTAEELYISLHPERQKLIAPIYEPDECYISQWKNVEYTGKDFYEDIPEFYTSAGERVRSKSEIIIADLLSKENIPYRYEYPLYLKGLGKIFPDFTTLNTRTRKEFIWEHLGMMDDPMYAENALQKISAYEQNGFFPGENLILTFESKKNPLNQKLLSLLIQKHLK